MRVLITGATGFAGRHLADLCRDRGDEVVGLARHAGEGVIACDLRDDAATAAAVREVAPERVFHLAADASVAASWSEPRETLENNLFSTLNLFEAVRREAPAARVLMIASGEVYGPAERLPVTEDAPLSPRNPYAVSKVACDTLAGFYADAKGLEVLRARAFNHAGPGQSDAYVVSSFARQIAEAEAAGGREVEILTGDLRPRRDFTDVRDVVRAYLLLLERAPVGAYNVCSGESVAAADILAGLARHTQLEVRQRTDPARVRASEVMEIRGSHERLTEATGWRPEIPLERTLADALDWWRSTVREGVPG